MAGFCTEAASRQARAEAQETPSPQGRLSTPTGPAPSQTCPGTSSQHTQNRLLEPALEAGKSRQRMVMTWQANLTPRRRESPRLGPTQSRRSRFCLYRSYSYQIDSPTDNKKTLDKIRNQLCEDSRRYQMQDGSRGRLASGEGRTHGLSPVLSALGPTLAKAVLCWTAKSQEKTPRYIGSTQLLGSRGEPRNERVSNLNVSVQISQTFQNIHDKKVKVWLIRKAEVSNMPSHLGKFNT